MLARYRIHRGKRPPDDPLPDGVRQDTRKHTRHPLRPTPEIVAAFLSDQSAEGWKRFKSAYNDVLVKRFKQDSSAFDDLAELATNENVYLGCSCPSRANPDVKHCHTYLALQFMRRHYPDLKVTLPA